MSSYLWVTFLPPPLLFPPLFISPLLPSFLSLSLSLFLLFSIQFCSFKLFMVVSIFDFEILFRLFRLIAVDPFVTHSLMFFINESWFLVDNQLSSSFGLVLFHFLVHILYGFIISTLQIPNKLSDCFLIKLHILFHFLVSHFISLLFYKAELIN